ncbi:uncharacterized protein DS421_17g575390 [Arachis hypogaea]|nr:uncharacterized protein DS421_17g575390 [Arachis hypogaea]
MQFSHQFIFAIFACMFFSDFMRQYRNVPCFVLLVTSIWLMFVESFYGGVYIQKFNFKCRLFWCFDKRLLVAGSNFWYYSFVCVLKWLLHEATWEIFTPQTIIGLSVGTYIYNYSI